MEKPAKHFMYTTFPLGVDPYVPIRTRDPLQEEFRRAGRGTGALIMSEQGHGINVINRTLESLEGWEDRRAFARLGAGALLLSSHYLFKGDREPMNRVVKLPILKDQYGNVATPEDIEDDVTDALQYTARVSHDVSRSLYKGESISQGRKRRLARELSSTAALLSVYPLESIDHLNESEAQKMARDSMMETWGATIKWAHELDQEPSVAQFAVRDSKVGQYIQTNDAISNDTANAYSDAIDTLNLGINPPHSL